MIIRVNNARADKSVMQLQPPQVWFDYNKIDRFTLLGYFTFHKFLGIDVIHYPSERLHTDLQ